MRLRRTALRAGISFAIVGALTAPAGAATLPHGDRWLAVNAAPGESVTQTVAIKVSQQHRPAADVHLEFSGGGTSNEWVTFAPGVPLSPGHAPTTVSLEFTVAPPAGTAFARRRFAVDAVADGQPVAHFELGVEVDGPLLGPTVTATVDHPVVREGHEVTYTFSITNPNPLQTIRIHGERIALPRYFAPVGGWPRPGHPIISSSRGYSLAPGQTVVFEAVTAVAHGCGHTWTTHARFTSNVQVWLRLFRQIFLGDATTGETAPVTVRC
jgi:hypothetical protein